MEQSGITSPTPTPDEITAYSLLVFSKLEGAVTAGMIHLGDQLGLYRALSEATGALSSAELAAATELHERWVREWAANQAAAGLLELESAAVTAEGDARNELPRFALSPAGRMVCATPDHPAFGMGMFHRLPQTMRALEHMPQAFRSGIGFDYDSHGPEGAVGIERSFEPWNNAHLIPTVLPTLEGWSARLQQGATVADVGCGAGGAAILMARTFPNSQIHGYDISQHALERAEAKKAEAAVDNVWFHDPRVNPLPADHSVDLITTFDCIHDMTDPLGMMRAIRAALAPDGVWLLVDIKAHPTLEGNIRRNPVASLMYGISVLSCMSSALSEPGGAGLGTLGLPSDMAESMARQAGFTRFRTLPVEHTVNAFYEVRP